jgi:putative phosphoesterase
MRIALVSDTHLPRFGRVLPRALIEGITAAGVERILHAGDWTLPFVVGLLEAIAPVEGVAGNNDAPELLARFGLQRVVEIGGVRIGLTHGHLGRSSITTPERAIEAFADEPGLDAIVFGHSHVPLVRRLPDGRWLANPGSPTDRRRQAACTWALMTIDGGVIRSIELVLLPLRGVLNHPRGGCYLCS